MSAVVYYLVSVAHVEEYMDVVLRTEHKELWVASHTTMRNGQMIDRSGDIGTYIESYGESENGVPVPLGF